MKASGKRTPQNSVTKAREAMERNIAALEALIKPSEAAFNRRMTEITSRQRRYESEITRAVSKARKEFLGKVSEKRERIAEIRAALTALEDVTNMVPLKALRDEVYSYFKENDIDNAQVSEFVNRIANNVKCSASAQFSKRVFMALENDPRFEAGENGRFSLVEE